jgi:hypothetical protein
MSTQKWLWIGGGLLVLSAIGKQQQPDAPASPVVPGADKPLLDAGTHDALLPVKTLASQHQEAAAKIAPFYRAAGDVVRRDDGKLVTTGQFRSGKVGADNLYLQRTPLVGSIPGLGNAVDGVIIAAIGLEDRPIDAGMRAKLADALAAIADAMEGR